MGQAKFADHLPAVPTIKPGADNPMSHHDHTQVAGFHARVGAALEVFGHQPESEAHYAAAKYHNALADRKRTQKSAARTPAHEGHLKTARSMFDQSLAAAAHLDDATRERYRATAGAVLDALPEKAAERFARFAKGADFHASTQQLSDSVASRSEQLAAHVRAGKRIGGTFNARTGRFQLDGDLHDTHARGVYAHEFGHAIDGDRRLSTAPGWVEAWQDEIVNKKGISDYAASKPREGFAEFGRLVYGGDHKRDEIKAAYPRCAEFWERLGLL
jgi:hypothetical protein